MKILYARQYSVIKNSLDAPYQRGTRLRLEMISSMRAQGHTVEFVSPVQGEQWSREIDNGADVLFIENGPTNPLYTYKDGNERGRYKELMIRMLKTFRGRVFYYQQDGRLPFMQPHIRPVTVLTHAEDLATFRESRKHYRDNKLVNFRHIPLLAGDNSYPEMIINPNPEYDLAYCGREHDRNRTNKLLKFYSQGKVLFVGEWKNPPIPLTSMENVFGNTMNVYNQALCVVQIADKPFERYRMPTTRILEAVRAGAVLLCDNDLDLEFFELGERVRDADEVMLWVKELRENPSYRAKIIADQRSRISTWRCLEWEKLLV